MQKTSNRDRAVIADLMEVTFPYRRHHLLQEPERVDKVVADYPALQLVSEVCICSSNLSPQLLKGLCHGC